MQIKLFPAMVALAFFATSVLAAPQVRYRLTPITTQQGGFLTARSMNSRGEVVGAWSTEDGDRGFYWHKGRLVELRDQVNPGASFVEAASINDRSQIVGSYSDPVIEGFRGFLLERKRVRDVQGPPGALHIFANLITNREQILGASYDAAGNFSTFLNDDGTVEVFDPSFEPASINTSGTVSGRQVADGVRAAIWEDGEITPIGPLFSSGGKINDRGQVIGSMNTNVASRAFVWERGHLTVLPALRADQTSNSANDINNSGRIVGETAINQPAGTVQIATVWDNGQVTDLNTLIHPNDRRRGFVTLRTGTLINDRGEIVAQGTDSRFGLLEFYFLEPVRR